MPAAAHDLAACAHLDPRRPAVRGKPAHHGVGVHHTYGTHQLVRVERGAVLSRGLQDRSRRGLRGLLVHGRAGRRCPVLLRTGRTGLARVRAAGAVPGERPCPGRLLDDLQDGTGTVAVAAHLPRGAVRVRCAPHSECLRQPCHLGRGHRALGAVHGGAVWAVRQFAGGAVDDSAAVRIGFAGRDSRRLRRRAVREVQRERGRGAVPGRRTARVRTAPRRSRGPVRRSAPGQQHGCRHRGDGERRTPPPGTGHVTIGLLGAHRIAPSAAWPSLAHRPPPGRGHRWDGPGERPVPPRCARRNRAAFRAGAGRAGRAPRISPRSRTWRRSAGPRTAVP